MRRETDSGYNHCSIRTYSVGGIWLFDVFHDLIDIQCIHRRAHCSGNVRFGISKLEELVDDVLFILVHIGGECRITAH